jgi:hypothetical protein
MLLVYCGADAGLLKARKRLVNDIDFGLVGDIDEEYYQCGDFLKYLLEFPLVPVIAPITYDDRFGNTLEYKCRHYGDDVDCNCTSEKRMSITLHLLLQ